MVCSWVRKNSSMVPPVANRRAKSSVVTSRVALRVKG